MCVVPSRQSSPTTWCPRHSSSSKRLPLTPNGKIDRKALSARDERLAPDEPYAAPGSPAEKTLARIWSEVLAVERVGIHDNFFQLGGDSIISIQIIARAREAGLDLTLRQLFQNQTVAELAAVAGAEAGARAEQGTLEGEVPLMPIQHWFFEQQPVDAHHFNLAALIETPGGLDPTLLEQATAHLLVHHDALRLRFRKEDGRWRQFYQPRRCLAAISRGRSANGAGAGVAHPDRGGM